MSKETPKYVQLEPAAWLTDCDVQLMTTQEVGAYWLLCLNLYASGGKLKYDLDNLCKLCKVNGDFDFQTVLSKFQVRRGFIYHKRVTKELRKSQLRVKSAVKAANTRWSDGCGGNASALQEQCQAKGREAKRSEGNISKENNTNTNDNKKPIDTKNIKDPFVILCEKMSVTFRPTTKDAYALAEIAKYLHDKNPKWLIDALDWVEQAKDKLKPIAYFVATIKRETGWKSKPISKTVGRNTSS